MLTYNEYLDTKIDMHINSINEMCAFIDEANSMHVITESTDERKPSIIDKLVEKIKKLCEFLSEKFKIYVIGKFKPVLKDDIKASEYINKPVNLSDEYFYKWVKDDLITFKKGTTLNVNIMNKNIETITKEIKKINNEKTEETYDKIKCMMFVLSDINMALSNSTKPNKLEDEITNAKIEGFNAIKNKL